MEEHDPGIVPNSPSSPKSLATGSSPICTGTTNRATTTRKTASRPGKSSQAKAYPASAARTTTSTVAGTEISTVFQNACVIPAFFSNAE